MEASSAGGFKMKPCPQAVRKESSRSGGIVGPGRKERVEHGDRGIIRAVTQDRDPAEQLPCFLVQPSKRMLQNMRVPLFQR